MATPLDIGLQGRAKKSTLRNCVRTKPQSKIFQIEEMDHIWSVNCHCVDDEIQKHRIGARSVNVPAIIPQVRVQVYTQSKVFNLWWSKKDVGDILSQLLHIPL